MKRMISFLAVVALAIFWSAPAFAENANQTGITPVPAEKLEQHSKVKPPAKIEFKIPAEQETRLVIEGCKTNLGAMKLSGMRVKPECCEDAKCREALQTGKTEGIAQKYIERRPKLTPLTRKCIALGGDLESCKDQEYARKFLDDQNAMKKCRLRGGSEEQCKDGDSARKYLTDLGLMNKCRARGGTPEQCKDGESAARFLEETDRLAKACLDRGGNPKTCQNAPLATDFLNRADELEKQCVAKGGDPDKCRSPSYAEEFLKNAKKDEEKLAKRQAEIDAKKKAKDEADRLAAEEAEQAKRHVPVTVMTESVTSFGTVRVGVFGKGNTLGTLGGGINAEMSLMPKDRLMLRIEGGYQYVTNDRLKSSGINDLREGFLNIGILPRLYSNDGGNFSVSALLMGGVTGTLTNPSSRSSLPMMGGIAIGYGMFEATFRGGFNADNSNDGLIGPHAGFGELTIGTRIQVRRQ